MEKLEDGEFKFQLSYCLWIELKFKVPRAPARGTLLFSNKPYLNIQLNLKKCPCWFYLPCKHRSLTVV